MRHVGASHAENVRACHRRETFVPILVPIREKLFEFLPRVEERAELEFDRAEHPVGVHRMIRPSLGFSLPEVGLGNLQRSRETLHATEKPQTARTPGSNTRDYRARRLRTHGRARPPLAPPRCPTPLPTASRGRSRYASWREPAAFREPPGPARPPPAPRAAPCASTISGICGVGVKPSSAGARTAWASAGRAVD